MYPGVGAGVDDGRSGGIVTPEAVLLEFADAGLGSRSVGAVIDVLARLTILFVGLIVAGFLGAVNEVAGIVTVVALVFSVVLVYPVVFEVLWSGRTPGKAALGLRVVTVEGAPCRFRHAAIRSALGLVDFFIGFGAPAMISALLTRRGQRLGDLAAGTMVIRERQSARADRSATFAPWPGWEGFAAGLDVGALTPEQYAVVRSFLLRAHQLSPGARWSLVSRLAAGVAEAIGVDLGDRIHPEGLVVAVAAAYQLTRGGPPPPPGGPVPAGSLPPAPGSAVPVTAARPPALAPGWGLAPVEWR